MRRVVSILVGSGAALAACRSSSSAAPKPSASSLVATPVSATIPAGASFAPREAGATDLVDASTPAKTREDIGPPRLIGRGRGLVATGGGTSKGSLKAILCEERTPCRLLETHDAGRDANGNGMTVAKVSLRARSVDRADPAYVFGDCEPFEYWLVTRDARGVIETELLEEMCNDGYGASGVGEDVVEIAENRFTHTQSGGSAWRWETSKTISLSPRRIVKQSSSGFWTVGPNRSSNSWDWEAFDGLRQNYTPECDANGRPPDDWLDRDHSMWVPIPVVEVEPEFAANNWKTAHLGACAAKVGTGTQGFVIHGNHGGPTDSTTTPSTVRRSARKSPSSGEWT